MKEISALSVMDSLHDELTMRMRLDAQMVRWVESWQDCWAWRELINSFDV